MPFSQEKLSHGLLGLLTIELPKITKELFLLGSSLPEMICWFLDVIFAWIFHWLKSCKIFSQI